MYDCHHGPDRNGKAKLKRKQEFDEVSIKAIYIDLDQRFDRLR